MSILSFRATTSSLLFVLASAFHAAGQGALEPTAPPAPTQKSLQQIWDKIDGLETKVSILEAVNADLTATVETLGDQLASNAVDDMIARRELVDAVVAASGLPLPWQSEWVDTSSFSTNPSLAFGPDGKPAVAHFHAIPNPGTLSVATLNSSQPFGNRWGHSVVFNTPGGDRAGYQSMLRFAPDGTLTVLFQTAFRLYLAEWKAGAWEVDPVDSDVKHRGSPALAFDEFGFPAICYVANWDLKFARRQSDGVWDRSVVIAEDPGVLHELDGFSYPTALAFTADGSPRIAYVRETMSMGAVSTLKYAAFDGAGWVIEEVSQFVGEEAFSFALSRDGLPHLAFVSSNKVVIEAKGANGFWTRWSADESHPANSPSLTFDLRDRPVVAYADEQSGDIVYAQLDGGEWTYEPVAAAGADVGDQKIALAITPGGLPAMAYADQESGGIRYLYRALRPRR